MAKIILPLFAFLSVWCMCNCNRLRRLETRVAKIEESAVRRKDLAECAVGDEIAQKLEEVKTAVSGLNAYMDRSIEGLKEEILKELREISVTSCGQTNAPTQTPKHSIEATAVSKDQITITTTGSTVKSPSCLELYKNGERQSGVYTIHPRSSEHPVKVYCDMDTDGGGWTMFQRRQDGSVDFYRTWDEYASGFGDLEGEFWLGNDLISTLINEVPHELRVDMEDFAGHSAHATYNTFRVSPRDENYTLEVSGFTGDAGDSLSYHSGWAFTTKDRDHDKSTTEDAWSPTGNCAKGYFGGWWYHWCHFSNLNGLYGRHLAHSGVVWYHWKSTYHHPLRKADMKFRARSHA